jgi:hypothetical protein
MNHIALPTRYRRMARRVARSAGAIALFSSAAWPAAAQRPRPGADSVPLPADYRDLGELLEKLPNIAPPTFDEAQAAALGAIQLSCLDRLQPPVPPRPGARRTATDADSAARGDNGGRDARATASDSARAAPANNRGEGYFWVTTYRLVPRNNQTRAFWGCSDWHSAVSATWATAYLLRHFPNSSLQDISREKLADHLGASNLRGELDFFHAAAASINPIPFSGQRGLFERPYGFAWLLELQSELYTWPDSGARKWAADVAPLAQWMSDSLGAYVAALPEPARSGSQSNTALSLMLALHYANTTGDAPLRARLMASARRFYLGDKRCDIEAEAAAGAPSRSGRGGQARTRGGRAAGGRGAGARSARARGATPDTGVNDLSAPGATARARRRRGGRDVVSPCLTEAALMSAVLPPAAFVTWLNAFLPPLESGRFRPLTVPAGGTSPVASADDSARFSGLSFQRAQAMERIAHALPASDPRVPALHRLSAIHAARGFALMRGNVEGISWLPAYALLYIDARTGS